VREPGEAIVKRLIGVGVGPGDPELVTVKGVRVLREADVVVVPVLEGQSETGRAEATVLAYVPADRVRRLPFALTDRGGVTPAREAAWDGAARAVLDAFAAGALTVAFATIGDPNLYSTFGYLAATVVDQDADIRVETVPGVTAMQHLAARAGTVLAEGRETLTLVPITAGGDAFEAALRGDGTVVAYKGGRHLPELLDTLKRAGRLDDAVYGEHLGLAGERVVPARELDAAAPAPYLSALIVTARREGRGGKR
jgi:precorrin-2/cobalt-factor-2 C20-methyltransferase